MALEVIILAAGQGTRMKSDLPKVLHKLANKPMLMHVLDTAATLNPEAIHVVTGFAHEQVEQAINDYCAHNHVLTSKVNLVYQAQQLGTGDAVNQVAPHLKSDSSVLVLYGDTPLVPKEDLKQLLLSMEQYDYSILSAVLPNPYGYGRILRNNAGLVVSIVEEKDATSEQKLLHEVNMGMVAAKASILKDFLPKLSNNNAQGEYYLTDLVGLVNEAGLKAGAVTTSNIALVEGANSKLQLHQLERTYQRMQAERLMLDGLSIADTQRFDLRGSLKFGQDCFIDANVIIEGNVVLGDRVSIGAGCVLRDVTIESDSVISPYTIMESSHLKQRTTIGPFARLRPGNVLEDDVHVGNFVEVKNSHIMQGTKAGHLTYLGDSDIGEGTNIGAGTITCNYDGANKHRTVIGKNVFVGSDTQLVAPVTVEDGATIAAGTTVTKRVPANQLVLTRVRPTLIENYKRPVKQKK